MEEIRRVSREHRLAEEQANALKFLQQAEEQERERIRNEEVNDAIAIEDALLFDRDSTMPCNGGTNQHDVDCFSG